MLVSAAVNRPWVVRSIAVLLVLVGLQAGSFRGPDTGDERYYGTSVYGGAVAPEAGKSQTLPSAVPAAQWPRAAHVAHVLQGLAVRTVAFHFFDSTGPPRA
jgi:hypothetical protein